MNKIDDLETTIRAIDHPGVMQVAEVAGRPCFERKVVQGAASCLRKFGLQRPLELPQDRVISIAHRPLLAKPSHKITAFQAVKMLARVREER